MWNNIKINSIRILPNDKGTFKTEHDFRSFVTDTMIAREGLYCFPNAMMRCPNNTLVLFQYDGMIRAVGLLIDAKKVDVQDENGFHYAGYYKFDVETLMYLAEPIDKSEMKSVWPRFSSFNQAKQRIDLKYLDSITELLQNKVASTVFLDDEKTVEKIDSEIEELQLFGVDKEAVVKVRINQSAFREKMIKRYHKCCLCGVRNVSLLTASHIKPWSQCSAVEKLDVENGFLLCPNHDKLFDYGFISFDDEGKVLVSDKLAIEDRLFLNVRMEMKVSLTERNKEYLKFHRNEIFKK